MNIFFNILKASINTSSISAPTVEPIVLPDVYIIPQFGQSLSLSQPPDSFDYIHPLSYNTSLVNDNVTETVGGLAEGFQLYADSQGITLPTGFKIIGIKAGKSGASIDEISKGTAQYGAMLNQITTAKNSCNAAGLTFRVPCWTWTQGEGDMQAANDPTSYGVNPKYDPLTYDNRLEQLVADVNTDIKAITGQSEDIMCLSYQVASHNNYARYPRIGLQHLAVADRNPLVTIGKVMYNLDYYDDVHAQNYAYRNMGNMYGVSAFDKSVNNIKPKYVRPLSHVVNGLEVTITFDVPKPPLALDTTWITQLSDGNYGFNILNVANENVGTSGTISEATTRINSVALSGTDKVVLSLSRTPVTGERITYGVNGTGWTDINGTETLGRSGRVNGGRGCLRDSLNITNNNTGVVFTELYNWSVIFEIII